MQCLYKKEMMINSTSNKQMKNITQLLSRAKSRREQGLFVVEGPRMFAEVPKDRLVKAYVSESFYEKKEQEELLKDCDFEIVADRVFSAVSDTKTPQGVLCLVRQKTYSIGELLPKDPFLLLLEDIQDPGNLGTIFRTAEAAGVTGILMSGGTADIYNPKTIRATMGSIYRMPFAVEKDLTAILPALKERGLKTYAAHLKGSKNYTKVDYRGGCAFMIGNEGNGLSKELSDRADQYIKIPMDGQVESLNAAVAASVLMFEAKRQRMMA